MLSPHRRPSVAWAEGGGSGQSNQHAPATKTPATSSASSQPRVRPPEIPGGIDRGRRTRTLKRRDDLPSQSHGAQAAAAGTRAGNSKAIDLEATVSTASRPPREPPPETPGGIDRGRGTRTQPRRGRPPSTRIVCLTEQHPGRETGTVAANALTRTPNPGRHRPHRTATRRDNRGRGHCAGHRGDGGGKRWRSAMHRTLWQSRAGTNAGSGARIKRRACVRKT